MNQGPTGTTIAVDKRVNGFKLRVGYGRLRYRRKRILVAKLDEILDELFHLFGRRRYEGCTTRVVVTASDPVLEVSELTALVFEV